ncbi:MAG: TetR/AcrR family transcriptional regulator, partial [Proteobacteria bacterium]|nr:TetR/AcrR family transcriptional regulator [Pseudomonadota bacterium]
MGKGADTREVILARAVALASTSGLSGITIGGLAKDLGLSKSWLIAHFGTKESLDLAVLQAAAKLFGETVIVPAFDSAPGEARLRVLFDNWFRYVTRKELPGGDLFFAAIGEFDDRPGICRYYVARVQRDWMQTLENATREAMQLGQFRPELDTGQISFTILSILNGYHILSRLLNVANAETRARAAFESLMAR